MDFSDNYLLTLGTFLPMVGVLVMMFIPAAEETLHKQIAILTSGATLAVGIWTLVMFDYGRSEMLQFAVDEKWIEVIHSNYTIGLDGISLPLYILSMAVTFLVVDLHLEQHARRRQPEVVPDPDARAPGRYGGHVHRPGPDPVLRVLRGRAAADVLHDRRVGRRAASVRVAQVLPLHDVRIGADAGRLPRPVLPDRRRELRFRTPDRSRRRYRPRRPGVDLRRHVRRVRRQGPDVPVPHLAARRPHPGAHPGFGDPGRDPAEARHLRLRADRDPDAAAGCPGVGAGDRHPRRDRHHLRRPRMPRPDRHEASDRVLVGGPHGVRDARHLDPHRDRHQRRPVRHGRPRSDHRHAVLRRRLGQAPLPHARDQPPVGDADPDAEARLDPRLLRDGLARPARTGRVLGRVPGDAGGVATRTSLSATSKRSTAR